MRRPLRTSALWLVGGLSAVVLVLTAGQQIFDANFVTLWEATEVLAGDHPYRDFFEWGAPLQVAIAAVAQVTTGHRLIGEFLIAWTFIVAGVVVSTRLALELTGSTAAALATMLIAVVLLAATPLYHFPKLFF